MQSRFNLQFDDNFPIEYDPKLNQILDNTEFICVTADPEIKVDVDGIDLTLVSSNLNRNRVTYLPSKGGKYDVSVHKKKLQIWYLNGTQKKAILYEDIPVDGVWKLVLVRDTVIIAYHPSHGLVCYIDVIHNKCYENAQFIDEISGMADVIILYDQRSEDVVFIRNGGDNHLRMSLQEFLPPIYFYADDLMNGYIREEEDLLVPLAVIGLIALYFSYILEVI